MIFVFILVDLLSEGKDRGMPAQEVEDFAKKVGADVFETSAKTGHNINEAFNKIAEDFVRKKKGKVGGSNAAGNVSLDDKPPVQPKGGCCS